MTARRRVKRRKAEKEEQRLTTRKRPVRGWSQSLGEEQDEVKVLKGTPEQAATLAQRQAAVLHLQRTRGNAYVQRMLGLRGNQEKIARHGQPTTQPLVSLWGKVRSSHDGQGAGGIQRTTTAGEVKLPRRVEWGLQRKTCMWCRERQAQIHRAIDPRRTDSSYDKRRLRIRRLKYAARKLRELANQPIPPNLSVQAALAEKRYAAWLGKSSDSLSALAGDWESSTESLFEATQAMQEMNQSFNLQYLQLQQNMQQENRQFTLVSNIMKVKHDTAKNAINNVR